VVLSCDLYEIVHNLLKYHLREQRVLVIINIFHVTIFAKRTTVQKILIYIPIEYPFRCGLIPSLAPATEVPETGAIPAYL
jgi:hypothetical protein